MIDVSKYEKIGEFRDGSMNWLSPKKDNMVYLIMFGADGYIGSTIDIRRRFSQYISALKQGKYYSKTIQKAFDNNGCFDVYMIASSIDENELRRLENHYLKLLHPSLNSQFVVTGFYRLGLPRYKCQYCKEWFYVGRRGVKLKSKGEAEQDIKRGRKIKDSNIIHTVCPNCGHELNIFIKYHKKQIKAEYEPNPKSQ